MPGRSALRLGTLAVPCGHDFVGDHPGLGVTFFAFALNLLDAGLQLFVAESLDGFEAARLLGEVRQLFVGEFEPLLGELDRRLCR